VRRSTQTGRSSTGQDEVVGGVAQSLSEFRDGADTGQQQCVARQAWVRLGDRDAVDTAASSATTIRLTSSGGDAVVDRVHAPAEVGFWMTVAWSSGCSRYDRRDGEHSGPAVSPVHLRMTPSVRCALS